MTAALAPQSRRSPRPTSLSDEAPRGLSPVDLITTWRREGALERLATGWPSFDAATRGGFVVGRIAFALGAPNAGKTAVAASLLWKWATAGIPCGMLCVDEEPSDVLTRLAVAAGATLDAAEGRSSSTLDALERDLGRLPVRLYGEEWTIEAAARDYAVWARGIGRRGAFLADSVQTIRSAGVTNETSKRAAVGMNVAALRQAARAYQFAGIATGEVPRTHYSDRGDGDMAAGKESGAIEFGALAQFVLRRPKKDGPLIRVSAPKIKRGSKDTHAFMLHFDRATHSLTEVASETDAGDATLRARILEIAKATPCRTASAIAKSAKGRYQAAFAETKNLMAEGVLVVTDDGTIRPKEAA